MGQWFLNTAGIGSIIVFTVGLSVFCAYVYLLRWIQTAPPDPAAETGQSGEEAVAIETGGEPA